LQCACYRQRKSCFMGHLSWPPFNTVISLRAVLQSSPSPSPKLLNVMLACRCGIGQALDAFLPGDSYICYCYMVDDLACKPLGEPARLMGYSHSTNSKPQPSPPSPHPPIPTPFPPPAQHLMLNDPPAHPPTPLPHPPGLPLALNPMLACRLSCPGTKLPQALTAPPPAHTGIHITAVPVG